MWHTLFLTVIICFALGIVWMSFAVTRFRHIREYLPKRWWKRMLCGAGIMGAVMLSVFWMLDFINLVIIFLHLLVIWMVIDGISWCILKITDRHPNHYLAGIASIVLTTLWLSVGWYNAHHVGRTEYNLTTTKSIGVGQFKIIGLSDSHLGATFHYPEFEEYVDRINAEQPDIVVIMGDFVDDSSPLEDMERCSQALSRLKTRHGVYFVYGNHDESYWSSASRGYTLADLEKHLQENGVRILGDKTIPLVGNILLCGRHDKIRTYGRKNASELMEGIDPEQYVICLDHEPNDYEAEAESGMDLVISGHTHGGQFFGFGPMGVAMGANDAYYGHERRGSTDFIVSSGIGDWAIKFKTGCIAEYIVISVNSN